MDIASEQRRLYEESYRRHGNDPRALFHNDRESQEERFGMLARCFSRERQAFTVHEVGCALGHFGEFLRRAYPLAVFSGSDIYEPFVQECRSRFPGGEFHLRDITETLPSDRYDYVVICGTFNVPGSYPREEWRAFVFTMLRAMFSMARKGMGATFLSSYYDPGRNREDLYYQDEKEVIDFAKRGLTRHVELDAWGPLYEYGLRAYQPAYVRTQYREPAFAKYFKEG